MGLLAGGALMDCLAWAMNVFSSVLIVFVNKFLMSSAGFAFSYATTLCAFHFLSCALAMAASRLFYSGKAQGSADDLKAPFGEILVFAVVGGVSVSSANISLMANSVGFYQIAKLMIVPFVCVVEITFFAKSFNCPTLASILMVLAGVGIVTVSDISVNTLGLMSAVAFIVSSGLQQITCGVLQRKHGITSSQLLAQVSPVQGVMLLCVGPFMDYLLTNQWILSWAATGPGIGCLVLSCIIAIAVNNSQYLCLGRFAATTFQVLGHGKTMLVLLGGWLFFDDTMSDRKIAGMLPAAGCHDLLAVHCTQQRLQLRLQISTYSLQYAGAGLTDVSSASAQLTSFSSCMD